MPFTERNTIYRDTDQALSGGSMHPSETLPADPVFDGQVIPYLKRFVREMNGQMEAGSWPTTLGSMISSEPYRRALGLSEADNWESYRIGVEKGAIHNPGGELTEDIAFDTAVTILAIRYGGVSGSRLTDARGRILWDDVIAKKKVYALRIAEYEGDWESEEDDVNQEISEAGEVTAPNDSTIINAQQEEVSTIDPRSTSGQRKKGRKERRGKGSSGRGNPQRGRISGDFRLATPISVLPTGIAVSRTRETRPPVVRDKPGALMIPEPVRAGPPVPLDLKPRLPGRPLDKTAGLPSSRFDYRTLLPDLSASSNIPVFDAALVHDTRKERQSVPALLPPPVYTEADREVEVDDQTKIAQSARPDFGSLLAGVEQLHARRQRYPGRRRPGNRTFVTPVREEDVSEFGSLRDLFVKKLKDAQLSGADETTQGTPVQQIAEAPQEGVKGRLTDIKPLASEKTVPLGAQALITMAKFHAHTVAGYKAPRVASMGETLRGSDNQTFVLPKDQVQRAAFGQILIAAAAFEGRLPEYKTTALRNVTVGEVRRALHRTRKHLGDIQPGDEEIYDQFSDLGEYFDNVMTMLLPSTK